MKTPIGALCVANSPLPCDKSDAVSKYQLCT